VLRFSVFWEDLPERQLNTEARNMYRVNRFQELMKHLPRRVFSAAVEQQQADKYRKGFSCWQQLITMIYAQLSGACSLRVLERSFNAHSAHHYHLDCQALRRSTLSDANTHSSPAVFTHLAQALMSQASRQLRRQGAELLQLLDSSSFTLQGPGFDRWTRENRTRNTQGVKLHVLYGLNERAPLQCEITPANVNDVTHAQSLPITPGARYVFDKGYCDYSWWWKIDEAGAFFVTRFKYNAGLQILEQRPIALEDRAQIHSDRIVRFAHKHPRGGRTHHYRAPLRWIEVIREGKPPMALATNDLDSPALRIAQDYRQRWQIELFFKWIKQHLRIKSFLGRSRNAVHIQILTALIAYLLVALYARTHALKHSLWMVLSELRSTLFQRSQTDYERHKHWQVQREQVQLKQRDLFA
jgi:putative transposase